MALTAATKLGPYEILGALGAGGMGEVYRARETRLDRTVAIKILPEHLSSDPERRARFEREARAISGLSHPNICSLFDIGDEDAHGRNPRGQILNVGGKQHGGGLATKCRSAQLTVTPAADRASLRHQLPTRLLLQGPKIPVHIDALE
jgi:serine/threonine protein kinase